MNSLQERLMLPEMKVAKPVIIQTLPKKKKFDLERWNFPEPKADQDIALYAMPEPNYILVQTQEQLAAMVADLSQYNVLALDTETSGLSPHINNLLLIQIAKPGLCYIIDFKAVGSVELLRPILTDEKVIKLIHNSSFDMKFVKHHARIEIKGSYDTYLAERSLTAGTGLRCSLDEVSRRRLGFDMSKKEREAFIAIAKREELGLPVTNQHIQPELLTYACRDVLGMFAIYKQQLVEIHQYDLEKTVHLTCRVAPVFADMELSGVKIDVERWRKMTELTVEKRIEALDDLMLNLPGGEKYSTDMWTGEKTYALNLNSPAQVKTVFAQIGVELEDTTKETLTDTHHPIVDKLVTYRRLTKEITSFGIDAISAVLNPVTGCIHSNFNIFGADTGRVSSSHINVQNIPATADFRSCFIAPEGYKMVVADYDAAELKIAGHLTQEPGFLKAFNEGLDLHSLTASKMFGLEYSSITKETPERKKSKIGNFSIIYGTGPQGLASLMKTTKEEAQKFLDIYFQTYPVLAAWLKKEGDFSVRNFYSTTIIGRRRFYLKPDATDEMEKRRQESAIRRQGPNAKIQGTCSDIAFIAMIKVQERIQEENLDAYLVLVVHDEVVLIVREDQAEAAKKALVESMCEAEEMLIPSVPAGASAKISNVWSK